MKLLNKLRAFYDKCVKLHCPQCNGIMDALYLDPIINKLVYVCRDCQKEWI